MYRCLVDAIINKNTECKITIYMVNKLLYNLWYLIFISQNCFLLWTMFIQSFLDHKIKFKDDIYYINDVGESFRTFDLAFLFHQLLSKLRM